MTSLPDASNDADKINAQAPDKVEVSVRLDTDLMAQVSRLTTDPSRVIEVALRQWLRTGSRRTEDDLSRPLNLNPPVPPKGEWND
ncbi:MAG: type II toxin-antitoxin system CcdA family antitoxin [Cyanobacteria bacterium P01_F01_bin.4]